MKQKKKELDTKNSWGSKINLFKQEGEKFLPIYFNEFIKVLRSFEGLENSQNLIDAITKKNDEENPVTLLGVEK